MRGLGVICITFCLSAAAHAQGNASDLIQAIRNNDLASLKANLAKGGGVVNTRDQRGSTLLMHAAAIGSPEAVKLLLESGADVNAKNEVEATALILGAGNPAKARMLVEKGADVNASSKMGRTPLLIAASCESCTVDGQAAAGKGRRSQRQGQRRQHSHRRGIVGEQSGSGETAGRQGRRRGCPRRPGLHLARQCRRQLQPGGREVSSFAKGANVNTANTKGGQVKFGPIQLAKLTPLMLASTFCAPDLVKTLLDAGAKVNDADIRGMTPVQFAVSSEAQNPAVVKAAVEGRCGRQRQIVPPARRHSIGP